MNMEMQNHTKESSYRHSESFISGNKALYIKKDCTQKKTIQSDWV